MVAITKRTWNICFLKTLLTICYFPIEIYKKAALRQVNVTETESRVISKWWNVFLYGICFRFPACGSSTLRLRFRRRLKQLQSVGHSLCLQQRAMERRATHKDTHGQAWSGVSPRVHHRLLIPVIFNIVKKNVSWSGVPLKHHLKKSSMLLYCKTS